MSVMTALLKNIFTTAPNHKSNKDVIRWWEQRRIFYNAVMLVAGLITIMLAILLNEIAFADLVNALPPVLIFALSANLFYTLGWMIEIFCRKLIPEKDFVQKAGPILFIAGISLSVFFTFAIDIAILIAFLFGN
jgi:hypothetical protein